MLFTVYSFNPNYGQHFSVVSHTAAVKMITFLSITYKVSFLIFLQCESNELKLLIQRVIAIETYVKEKQKQAGSQTPGQTAPSQGTTTAAQQPPKAVAPAVPVTGQAKPAQVSKAPVQQPPKPVPPVVPVPGQGQTAPAGQPQGPQVTPPQPPKATSSVVPAPGQGQPAIPVSPQGFKKPLPQPSTPITQPAPSPVSAPVQGQPAPAPAVPAGTPQVLWGSVTESPAPASFSSPLGVTVQSTLEAPGTFVEGNGQINIQVRKLGQ